SKGKNEAALGVLKRIREEKRAHSEVAEIEAADMKESEMKKANYKDLAVPWVRRIVLLGIGIAVVQQITGVNSIMYYGT
ncbi:MFS transporter, partial [Bacillus sp. GbtcB13]|uniref:MFS transporter n=1 Tax=Bacillus sp. GbtcB13 TaxID=2824758 RepID=UPI001C2F24A3